MFKLRLSSTTVEISEPLEHGQTVLFQGRSSVVKKTEHDNQDGTLNITWEAKIEIVDFRPTKDGQVTSETQVVVISSRSKKLKQRCFVLSKELGLTEAELYNGAMDEAEAWLDDKVDDIMGYLEK